MDEYAEVIGSEAMDEDYARIAVHFENIGNHFKAGHFFMRGKKYSEVHMNGMIYK